jgi:hypothetical protein
MQSPLTTPNAVEVGKARARTARLGTLLSDRKEIRVGHRTHVIS